ncbi:hypothetical protein B0F90DRAFT_412726 [Multifurca ochricompacta]|uniref:Uncharacterized protein n=1 Tax=Multifurca ochricompacta TaxID=376703 RepID=A0AAD4M4M6_9AGAM|nr:hypothetical protein B0F90DRAFT_412726 [Multifurca ochricompacta]
MKWLSLLCYPSLTHPTGCFTPRWSLHLSLSDGLVRLDTAKHLLMFLMKRSPSRKHVASYSLHFIRTCVNRPIYFPTHCPQLRGHAFTL